MCTSISSLKYLLVTLPVFFGGLGFTSNAVAQEAILDTPASHQQTSRESLTQSSNPGICRIWKGIPYCR
jgi:hypothetical protein